MKPIYLDNDYKARFLALEANDATGDMGAATGLTSIVALLSATKGGSAIHANLSVSMTESGSTGIYYGTFQGSDLTAQLNNATYKDKKIWLGMGKTGDLKLWVPLIVREFNVA